MPKPPRCGMCGAEHWSSQPCKGVTTERNAAVTESVTRNAAVTLKGGEIDAALRTRVTDLETQVEQLKELVFALRKELVPLVLHRRTNAERQKAYRERKKAAVQH